MGEVDPDSVQHLAPGPAPLHIRSISSDTPASRKYPELPSSPSWALMGDGVTSYQLEFSVNLALPISSPSFNLAIHFADPISCSVLPCHNGSPRIQGLLFDSLLYHYVPSPESGT